MLGCARITAFTDDAWSVDSVQKNVANKVDAGTEYVPLIRHILLAAALGD